MHINELFVFKPKESTYFQLICALRLALAMIKTECSQRKSAITTPSKLQTKFCQTENYTFGRKVLLETGTTSKKIRLPGNDSSYYARL